MKEGEKLVDTFSDKKTAERMYSKLCLELHHKRARKLVQIDGEGGSESAKEGRY